MQTDEYVALNYTQVLIEQWMAQIEKVILGKRDRIELAVIALLCRGHMLLEDVPGVGKTMLVRALAKTISGEFARIQFTPDVLPSDVTGVSMYNPKTMEFEYRPGPIMANVVLADEINRTSPKTQSALLEAMEERKVTVDGITYRLPEPFLLMATQNPLDFEGTYPLPEAQLDRFLMKINLGYPEAAYERLMLDRLKERQPIEQVKPVMLQKELVLLQQQVSQIHVDASLKAYIVHLVASTRTHPQLRLGASPRASIGLMQAAQAKALLADRTFVIPDDIKALALQVLGHRVILNTEAKLLGHSVEQVLQDIVQSASVPAVKVAAGS